jgi:molybdopterin converting factor subunit 1
VTVNVLLFASYAEALGGSSLQVEVPEGSSVRDLMQQLKSRAGGDRLPPSPLVAINQAYASLDERVKAGDEVAVIPPVAGG